MTEMLETVEVETGPRPDAAVLWLHGLGADRHDFEPLVPELHWPGAPAIRFVFPHAPVRPVTINGGMPMRAWYDIVSLGSGRDHDQQGITDSVNHLARLVRRERERGIAAGRIMLAGFSQGGAVALELLAQQPPRFAGAFAQAMLYPERGADVWKAAATIGTSRVFLLAGELDKLRPHPLNQLTRYAVDPACCDGRPQSVGREGLAIPLINPPGWQVRQKFVMR